jgi:small subunit ribosomal protein S15
MLSKSVIANTVSEFSRKSGDCGSPEVQVAILTKRIDDLSKHFEGHAKDHSSKRGLMKLIGQRKSLLKYLARKNTEVYQTLIQKLGLRK